MLFHFLSDFPTRRTSPKVRGTMLSFSLQHQLQASTSLRNEDIGVYEKHPAHGRTLININIVDILVYSARQEPGNMRGMVGSGEGPRISSKSTVLKPPARLWDAALPPSCHTCSSSSCYGNQKPSAKRFIKQTQYLLRLPQGLR